MPNSRISTREVLLDRLLASYDKYSRSVIEILYDAINMFDELSKTQTVKRLGYRYCPVDNRLVTYISVVLRKKHLLIEEKAVADIMDANRQLCLSKKSKEYKKDRTRASIN